MKLATALLPLLVCTAQTVFAQHAELVGVLGNKALITVDGGAPKAVAVGDSYHGVKVMALQNDSATVQAADQIFTLRLGEAPGASAGATDNSGGNRVVLSAGSGGHFYTTAQINGNSVPSIIDSGATLVTLNMRLADEIGLDYRKGKMTNIATANGLVGAWRLRLASLRVGDVTVYDIDAVVSAGEMAQVLLGNSFLAHFQMTRTNDQMVLEKRY